MSLIEKVQTSFHPPGVVQPVNVAPTNMITCMNCRALVPCNEIHTHMEQEHGPPAPGLSLFCKDGCHAPEF
jgi:hypothetical protein